MTVRYHMRHGQPEPQYICQKERVESAWPVCQYVVGTPLDEAVGGLLVEAVSPLALEVALTVQQELERRTEEVDRMRRQQVERARYQAELAQRRYLRIDPDNRLVADSLEADWNHKLRSLSEAQEDYEQKSKSDRSALSEQQRTEVMSLATDFPTLWRDPQTSMQERKRMVRLMVEDVTLLRGEHITAHVRFRGGATRTLDLARPLRAWELRQTDPQVVAEIDRLLNNHTDGEIVTILNQRGVRPGLAKRFSPRILGKVRRAYNLEDRFSRLRRRGLLTQEELASLLGVHIKTVQAWHHAGLLVSHSFDDKGGRLYERTDELPTKLMGRPLRDRPRPLPPQSLDEVQCSA